MFKNPPTKKQWTGHDEYFELTVPPDLMVALGDLLEGKRVPGEAITRLQTVWQFGRRVKLPYARLPWGELELEAKRQGISEAEVLWDRARAKDPSGL